MHTRLFIVVAALALAAVLASGDETGTVVGLDGRISVSWRWRTGDSTIDWTLSSPRIDGFYFAVSHAATQMDGAGVACAQPSAATGGVAQCSAITTVSYDARRRSDAFLRVLASNLTDSTATVTVRVGAAGMNIAPGTSRIIFAIGRWNTETLLPRYHGHDNKSHAPASFGSRYEPVTLSSAATLTQSANLVSVVADGGDSTVVAFGSDAPFSAASAPFVVITDVSGVIGAAPVTQVSPLPPPAAASRESALGFFAGAYDARRRRALFAAGPPPAVSRSTANASLVAVDLRTRSVATGVAPLDLSNGVPGAVVLTGVVSSRHDTAIFFSGTPCVALVISLSSWSVTATVPIPTTQQYCAASAIDDAAGTVYVVPACWGATGCLLVTLDARSGAVTGQITLPAANLGSASIVVPPNSDFLYVAVGQTLLQYGKVGLVLFGSIATVTTLSGPLAVSSDRSALYAGAFGTGAFGTAPAILRFSLPQLEYSAAFDTGVETTVAVGAMLLQRRDSWNDRIIVPLVTGAGDAPGVVLSLDASTWPTPATPSSSTDSASVGVIVGSVVGGLVVLAIIGYAVVTSRRAGAPASAEHHETLQGSGNSLVAYRSVDDTRV
jgi:hypothetical protein